jgi:hypothetical protein
MKHNKDTFSLLQLPNAFRSMQTVISSAKVILTPILINSTSSLNTHSLIILIDLKTNEIVGYHTLPRSWRYLDLNRFFTDFLLASKVELNNLALHTLKTSPFTTKGFGYFILNHKIILSYYTRKETLQGVLCAKVFFRLIFKDPLFLLNLTTLIEVWNTKVAPNLNHVLSSKKDLNSRDD